MYIGFFNVYETYNNNYMFTSPETLARDDHEHAIYLLGQYLIQRGHRLNTIDMEPDLGKYDAVVFLEFPTFDNGYFRQLVNINFENLYLILFESEMVKPENYQMENHRYFKKIATWHDGWVDNVKYLKFNYAHRTPRPISFNLAEKNKCCTLINSFRMSRMPMELYSERIRAILWFQENHPEDFDIYGSGWDYCYFPCAKGQIPVKKDVMKKYKFSICYENAYGFPGYISEKILDSLMAGCVPVYLGTPNITDHIPAATFIDRRNFRTYDELYLYLKGMSDTEYTGYLNAIKDFFESDKCYPFSVECFIDLVAHKMLGA